MTNELSIPSGTYRIDPGLSQIGFEVRHAMITRVRGLFPEVEASIVVGGEGAEHAANATIHVGSLDSGAPSRDGHLLAGDFFDETSHPTMTFQATDFQREGTNQATVIGDLMIKRNTRQVALKVSDIAFAEVPLPGASEEDPSAEYRMGFRATTTVNRKDFGLDFHAVLPGGGLLLSDEVLITIDASAILQT